MHFSAFLLTIAAAISISASDWVELEFDDVPKSSTIFEKSCISISVEESASPLVRIFPSPKAIRGFEVTGSVSDYETWALDADDALLRVGVIELGETRLNRLQKLTAPDWLKRLDELVGKTGGGVSSIRCFNLAPEAGWIGRTRTNPNASLFEETVQAAPDENGNFKILVEFDSSVQSPGLWLLADGDDSGSSFRNSNRQHLCDRVKQQPHL